MKILVINAGSSTIKYQMINMTDESVLVKGLAERIGSKQSKITHKPTGKMPVEFIQPLPDHEAALSIIFKALIDPVCGVVKRYEEIDGIGHRVAMGGDYFKESVLVKETESLKIEEYIELAPLHNPVNLMGIQACQKILPDSLNVAVFDTAFHQTMPAEAHMYAISYELYEKHAIRKYGFHGTSHKFVALSAADLMDQRIEDLNLITCHLGNGASLCAVKGGKSVDTSMGLTPLEGVPMGTRSGDIDPSIYPFLHNKGYKVEEINKILNSESGVLGVSGVSEDFRDLDEAAGEGNERAQLALDIYHYRVAKTIASYLVALGKIDGIVFTAGVGENSGSTRQAICDKLTGLGIQLDEELNQTRGKSLIVSSPESKITVMVIPTNEEIMIARDTVEIIKNL